VRAGRFRDLTGGQRASYGLKSILSPRSSEGFLWLLPVPPAFMRGGFRRTENEGLTIVEVPFRR